MKDAEASTRIGIAAAQLLEMQLGSGAWGQRPDSERGNTIATAQVLAVLARAGVPARCEAIGSAHAYLARSALEHARPVEEGGRGPYIRYVIHSLDGLHEYAATAAADVRTGRDAQLAWLLERQDQGGWADSPGHPISTHATAQALQVLRRAGAPSAAIGGAAQYLMDVRSPGGYWQLEELAPPSAAATGEAVLALHGLDAAVDRELVAALEWLDTNRRLWLRRVERQPIAGETWEHASFALAERALALHDAVSEPVGGSLGYLEELWDPAGKGWRFPGEVQVSVKGASVALLCFEAVLEATPLDLAAAALFAGAPSSLAGSPDGPWQIELRERQDLVIEIEGRSELVTLRPRLWDLLEAMAAESERVEGGFLRRERVAEAMGIGSRGTLSKEVTRLHERLALLTEGRLSEVVTFAGNGRWRLQGEISRRDDAGLPRSAL